MYHYSDLEFDMPVYEELYKNITNHSNGALGLWVAFERMTWAQGFGKHEYACFLEEDAQTLTMPIERFTDLCTSVSKNTDSRENEIEGFRLLRAELMRHDDVDCLMILEQGGRVDMGIILNFDKIRKFERTK